VPTLAKYLLRAGVLDHGHPRPSRNPFVRFHRAFERGFAGVREGYRATLEGCLRHRKLFIVTFVAGCAVSVALLPWVGRDFFPAVDAGQFKLHVRAKTGTRIEEMARICDLVEQEIRRIIPPDEIATILDNIGLPRTPTSRWRSSAVTRPRRSTCGGCAPSCRRSSPGSCSTCCPRTS
jgi:multidrug efflux pump subunit AcrB